MGTLRVGVAGATGYLGSEVLRILISHPEVETLVPASRSSAGKPVSEILPQLRGVLDAPLAPLAPETFRGCDFVLLATPHGVARALAPALLEGGSRVIDLSGDHRIRDPTLHRKVYGAQGADSSVAQEAVYGLPEIFGNAVKRARLVANPGCYPTAATLSVLPLLAMGGVEPRVIVDAKSGVSGAGREATAALHFPEMNEALRAYKVGEHRHEPEIAQTLAGAAGGAVQVTFTPHIVPLNRGIASTAYLFPSRKPLPQEEVDAFYAKFYAGAPFVRLVPQEPDVRNVRGTNFIDVKPHVTPGGVYVVTAAIDNLVKGGAGQAVQNMNLMAGFPEERGLPRIGGGP